MCLLNFTCLLCTSDFDSKIFKNGERHRFEKRYEVQRTKFPTLEIPDESLITAHELLSIVEGVETKLELDEARRKWIKRDAKAMHVLSTSMEYSQFDYLVTCTSAHEMWMKLSSIHEQKRKVPRIRLH